MRSDMAKVIVERPRYGSSDPPRPKGYRKSWQVQPADEWPKRGRMLGRWRGPGRSLSENLAPLRRFLRSNVGRPWNKIHQELCEHISFDNAVQKHLLTHLYEFVHRYVEERDRTIVHAMGYRSGRALRPGEMYLCPRTGLLKTVRPRRPSPPPTRVSYGPGIQFHRRDEVWWEVAVRPCLPTTEHLWDVWLERDTQAVTKEERLRAYGGDLIAVGKRPLTRQEQRRFRKDLSAKKRG